ncbi:MAG: hypothetical protein SPL32_06790 [Succiniclasticum sp.]|nr:hypothetical protein [Succiniclasticum sp.]
MVLIADEENIQEYDRLVAEGGHTEEELNMALYGVPKVMSMKDVFKKQREDEEVSPGK